MSVAWEMDRSQSVPHIEEVTVVEQSVGNERLEGQNPPPNAFQATRDLCPAMILRMPGIVVGVETRGGDPSARLSCDYSHVENVVKVPVRDDNATNRLALPPAPTESPQQKRAPADKATVEQIQP